MSKQWSVGINHMPAYQISGVPFVTSSASSEVPQEDDTSDPGDKTLKITFPYVTKFFQIQNNSPSSRVIQVGFSAEGANGNISGVGAGGQGPRFFRVAGDGTSSIYNLRTKELYFSCVGGTGGVTVIAGLTMIETGSFPSLTSSLEFRGV